MNLDELRSRAEAVEAEMRAIHTEAGDAALDTDQQSRWDELETEEREVREAIAHHEEEAEKAARVAERRARWGSVQVTPQRRDPFDSLERFQYPGAGRVRNDDAVDVALRAFDDKSVTRGLSDDELSTLVGRIQHTPGGAEYALAHGSEAYRSAYGKWVAAGGTMNADFTSEEFTAMREAQKMRTALNITTGASGQFSLPTVFDPTLIHTGTAAINPIRPIARVETGTQNVWNGVSTGNVTTYWHAESAALTDGAPTLAHPVVTAGHLTAYVPASWEFFDDSSMVAQLPGLIGEAFDYAESTAFVTGSGTSSPVGVVTAISATAACTVTATTRGSFTSASSADVFALVNAAASRYENTSVWVANKKSFNVIRQMSSSGQGSLFWGDLTGQVTPNQQYPLLGSPTINSSDMATTTTTGTVLIVLGDFKQYLVYDVLGTTIEMVQNVVNSSGIPTGQRAIVARKRVGGNVTDLGAFRFLLT